MVHSKGQKDKIRKSGLSLQNKAIKLGQQCDVFSALAYWNPTHKRMETVMYLPRGQTLPDMNRLVCVLTGGSLHWPVADSNSYAG